MKQPLGEIAILTDSSCDLPQRYYKKYPVFRLPLIVTSGETAYRDGVDITVDEVYRRQPDAIRAVWSAGRKIYSRPADAES